MHIPQMLNFLDGFLLPYFLSIKEMYQSEQGVIKGKWKYFLNDKNNMYLFF